MSALINTKKNANIYIYTIVMLRRDVYMNGAKCLLITLLI